MVTPSEAPTELIVVPDEPAPSRRRVLRIVLAAVGVAAVVGAGGIAWAGRPATGAKTADGPIAVQSATLITTDMSTAQSLPGTLGYGTARTVKGNREGTVTWLPAPGASVKRGQQLYRVDDRPVPLFYGGIPIFRTLQQRNLIGRDVRILADNLRALGYLIGYQPGAGERVAQTSAPATTPAPAASGRPDAAPVTHWVTVHRGDGVLTAGLQAAVKRWQNDLQLPATGAIGPGDVAVLTGAVRVDSLAAQSGDSADGPLISVTPTAKVITVLAEASQVATIEQGDRVTVELPDDKVAGRVATVGTALRVPDGDQSTNPKLTVTVTVDKPAAIAKLDSADVQVDFVAETHKAVLAAPVGALLALSEGGYAVQIAGGGLVPVEIGIFAKGLVEITGDGLAEGTAVVTTS